MKRNISCVVKPGNIQVDEINCLQKTEAAKKAEINFHGSSLRKITEAPCYVSCDHDCSVSSWSEWSQCSRKACISSFSGEQRFFLSFANLSGCYSSGNANAK